MKKFIKTLTIIITALTLFTACGGTPKSKDINIEETVKTMISSTTLKAELTQMSEKNVQMLYTKFDNSLISDYQVYVCASKATCEEIAVFRAKDDESASKVKEIVEQRVKDLITETKDYNPTEMPKLDQALITSNGSYVALIIADDTAPAEEAFKKSFN